MYNFGEEEPFLEGMSQLRSVYGAMFQQSPNLHAVLENKMVLNNSVIYHEKVTGRAGSEIIEVLAIYEIEENLIKRLTFIK